MALLTQHLAEGQKKNPPNQMQSSAGRASGSIAGVIGVSDQSIHAVTEVSSDPRMVLVTLDVLELVKDVDAQKAFFLRWILPYVSLAFSVNGADCEGPGEHFEHTFAGDFLTICFMDCARFRETEDFVGVISSTTAERELCACGHTLFREFPQVGSPVAHPRCTVWYCCSVVVNTQVQGKGIGTKLLTEALRLILERAAGSINPIVVAARTQNNLVVKMLHSAATTALGRPSDEVSSIHIHPLAKRSGEAAAGSVAQATPQWLETSTVLASALSVIEGDPLSPIRGSAVFDKTRLVFLACYPPHLIPVFSAKSSTASAVPQHCLLNDIMNPDDGDAALLMFVLKE